MPYLTLVMGLPGSGKSTLAATLKGEIISIDEVRKTSTGTYTPGKEESYVYETVIRLLQEKFQRNEDTILDGALLSVQRRKVFLSLAKKHGYNVRVYWLDVSHSLLEKRISQRNQTVEQDRQLTMTYIQKLTQYLEPPSDEEGIDEIYYVSDEDVT